MAWLQFRVSEAEGGPAPRECHTMLTVDRSLVIFGGNDSVARRNDLHIFDTDTMRWSTHVFEPPPPSDAAAPPPPAPSPDVPSRRSAHAAVMVDARYMLIFGGWDGAHELGDSYAYDLATHKWRRLATTGTPPAARHFHNCVIVGRKVLVFGGFDGQAWRSDLHSLDIGESASAHPPHTASMHVHAPAARRHAAVGGGHPCLTIGQVPRRPRIRLLRRAHRRSHLLLRRLRRHHLPTGAASPSLARLVQHDECRSIFPLCRTPGCCTRSCRMAPRTLSGRS